MRIIIILFHCLRIEKRFGCLLKPDMVTLSVCRCRHLANAFEQRNDSLAAALANGYYYLATGNREPAMIIVGLRTLVAELAEMPTER